jgi:hypothetical protein
LLLLLPLLLLSVPNWSNFQAEKRFKLNMQTQMRMLIVWGTRLGIWKAEAP